MSRHQEIHILSQTIASFLTLLIPAANVVHSSKANKLVLNNHCNKTNEILIAHCLCEIFLISLP